MEGNEVSSTKLLYWMSARGKGSWQQYRTAVEELHLSDSAADESAEDEDCTDQFSLPLYQVLRLNLQRLGHAEFYAGAGGFDWRVSPPSLAIAPYAQGWVGILTGARTLRLLQRLDEATPSVSLENLYFPACPDQIRIVTTNQQALKQIAERAGLHLQVDAPLQILACLPPIDDPAIIRKTNLPFGGGWKIERFSCTDLRWKTATHDDASTDTMGLFRFSLRHQREVLLCIKGAAFWVSSQVGKYIVLKRHHRRVLRYEEKGRRLLVPVSCRPPFLLERALILCSGLMPSYESDTSAQSLLCYHDIPGTIATLTAALLRQE